MLALFLFVGGVSMKAQTPDATPITDAEVPDGIYFIASTAKSAYDITSPYIAANGGSMKLVAKTAVTTDFPTSKVGLWRIKKIAGQTNPVKYSIQSLESNQYYWSAGPDCPINGTQAYYEIRQVTEGGDIYTFNGNGGPAGNVIGNQEAVNATSSTSFKRNNSGSYNQWKLIPAGVKNITINYTSNAGNTFSTAGDLVIGEVFTPSIDFYQNFNPASITVGDDNVYNVTCEENFPFEAGRFYTMKMREHDDSDNNTHGDNRNVVWDITSANINTRKTSAEAAGMAGYWRFERVPNTVNQVRLYTNAKGKSLAVTFANLTDNNSKATLSDAGTVFAVCPITPSSNAASYTNCFRLSNPNNDSGNLNDVNGLLGVWTAGQSKTDPGSTFTITEVSDQPTAVASAEVTDELGNTFTSNLTGYYWNSTVSTNVVAFPSDYPYLTLTTSTTNTSNEISFTVQNNFPFTVSKADAKVFQMIRVRDDDAHYVTASYTSSSEQTTGTTKSRENRIDVNTLGNISAMADKSSWAFVKKANTPNQFYIYNKTTDALQLYLANENQGTAATMAETGTAFYIELQPSEFTSFTGGFTIRPNASNSHALGDHGSGPLTYWTNRSGSSTELNDDGSIYRVVDTSSLVESCKNIITNNTGYVGCFSSTADLTNLNASTTLDDFFTQYDALRATSSNIQQPETGKYYRLYFKRNTQYVNNSTAFADAEGNVSEDDASRDLLTVAADGVESNVSTICNFVSTGTEGVFNIQNSNSKFWWGSTQANHQEKLYTTKQQTYGGKYSIVYDEPGAGYNQLLLKDVEITEDWCYLASRFDNAYGQQIDNRSKVSVLDGGLEPGVVVYIKEVTSYPVTFKAQYATLTLPFNVTLPADGVKAYVASNVSETTNGVKEIVLTEVKTTIPANTPVLLECTAETTPTAEATATYQLTIPGGENTSYSGTNLLSGTTVRRQGLTPQTYYGLSLNTEGEVGFNISNIAAVPANKAYLTKANLPQGTGLASYIRCSFGDSGETTGINENKTDTLGESNVYYDLNGHRVLYPTRGIYVKGNGQKVFIK